MLLLPGGAARARRQPGPRSLGGDRVGAGREGPATAAAPGPSGEARLR